METNIIDSQKYALYCIQYSLRTSFFIKLFCDDYWNKVYCNIV